MTCRTYQTKDYGHLLGMEGFSDALLENHFSLYQSHVAETSRILELLSFATASGRSSSTEHPHEELRRRLAWEWNGMRLHELYFENLGGKGAALDREPVDHILRDQFGTVDAWRKDFETIAKQRSVGWAILYYDSHSRRLLNLWVDEHDQGHPVGCAPILVLDVVEHAYLLDYGLNRRSYVEAFFENVRWKAVAKRFEEVALFELQVHEAAQVRWLSSAYPGASEVEPNVTVRPATPQRRPRDVKAPASTRLRPH